MKNDSFFYFHVHHYARQRNRYRALGQGSRDGSTITVQSLHITSKLLRTKDILHSLNLNNRAVRRGNNRISTKKTVGKNHQQGG